MILGLRTVVVYVRTEQLDEAKKWYASVVGVAPYFDTPYYVGFNVGGFELGIHPEGTPGPGGVCAYWGTPEISSEVTRLVGLGAKVVSEVQDVGEVIKVATVADPFGNHFGVIENPQFDLKAVK